MAEEEKIDESSKYNEAAMQIMRLHNLWVKIEENVNKGNLKEWQYLLDSVWRELRADIDHITDGEELTKENKLLKLRVLVAASKTKTEYYKALNKRHEFLKRLQDKSGKGGIYEDESEKGFE